MNSEDKTKIMNNQEKGITLVVLVITIVVMCILTGVTVHQTISENGLFHSITQIGRKSKNEQEEAAESTEEEIKDKLDTAEGVKDNKVANSIELACIEKWSDYITVQLNIGSYNFEGGEYGIENIKYAIKKTGEKEYSNYKIGTEGEYICKFDDLAEGTEYTIGAFAEYKDDNGKTAITENPIAESSAITTFKFKFKIGDWVDYDAGTWTQAEIDELNKKNLYNANYTQYKEDMYDATIIVVYPSGCIHDSKFKSQILKSQFSGMSKDYNKNNSVGYSYTGFSGDYSKWSVGETSFSYENEVNSGLKYGWRVLGINNKGQVELVSAGMPEWFLGRSEYAHLTKIGKSEKPASYYADEKAITNLYLRTFSEYLNDYASDVRIMNYEDVKKARKKSDLANIGASYILGTVQKRKSSYYSLAQAYNDKIWGTTSNKNSTRILFYKSDFDNTAMYSAGMLGVRVVVTLKDGYIPHNKKEGETAEKTGKSYSDRLYIVTKDEFEKLG